MNIITKLTMYVLILWATCTHTNVLQQNIALLIDNTEQSGREVISSQLGIFLCQKVCPVIVHKHTVSLFLAYEEKQGKKEGAFPAPHLVTWLDENWHAYFTGTNFYVLIPKGYVERLKEEFGDMPISDLLGINVPPSEQMQTFAYVNKNKEKMLVGRVGIKAEEIAALLRSGPEGSFKNIYMQGHGGIVNMQNNKELPKVFAAEKQYKPFDVTTYRAKVAGIDSVVEFRKLLNFFNTLSINFLYYSSCYAGGYLLYMPYVMSVSNNGAIVGGGVKPSPYTIVVGAATDAVTQQVTGYEKACLSAVPRGYSNPRLFFENIVRYTNSYMQKVAQAARFSDAELRDILLPISESADERGRIDDSLSLLPQVKFPHSEKFMYFAPDPQQIYIVTEAKIQKALRESSTIDIAVSKKQVPIIALPEAHMPIAIRITTGKPAIVSLLKGVGLQTIDTLEVDEASMPNILKEMRTALQTKFPRYFFIKNLKDSDRKYKNVLISVRNDSTATDAFAMYIDDTRGITVEDSSGSMIWDIGMAPASMHDDATDRELIIDMLESVRREKEKVPSDVSTIFNPLHEILTMEKKKNEVAGAAEKRVAQSKQQAVRTVGGVPMVAPPYARQNKLPQKQQ